MGWGLGFSSGVFFVHLFWEEGRGSGLFGAQDDCFMGEISGFRVSGS